MSDVTFFMPMLVSKKDIAFDDEDFLFEFKFDGVRTVLDMRDGIKLYNRHQKTKTHLYPEIINEAKNILESGTVLDGEIIAFDKAGNQSFYKVLERDLAKKYKSGGVDVCFVAFDILCYQNKDLTDKLLAERKKILDKAFVSGSKIRKSDFYIGEGKMLFAAAQNLGLEGIVAKRLSSVYNEGIRSGDWFKIKCERFIEAYAVAYEKTQNRISICLGVECANGYSYIGNVSNGLKEREWSKLQKRLDEAVTDKNHFVDFEPKGAALLEPITKLKVKYLEQDEGGKLRQPVIAKIF